MSLASLRDRLSIIEPIRGGAVSIDAVVKHYGSQTAVAGVNLEIEPGEFVALLGPSGSGKTTLLMMIAGFEQASEGAVRIDGADVSWMPPHRRNIGMVFQKYALFPHMTLIENVAFPLRMRGHTATERKRDAAAALRLVGLDGMERRLPGQLSGGQQQRVALARAIVYRPPVLLMDEPLGALDKKLRERMQIEIKRLQASLGATVIFVTHDQDEALTMADRIAVMNHGKIEQVGTPIDLYERPANVFVASFIGETNLLEAIIVGAEESAWVLRLVNGSVVRATPAAASTPVPANGKTVKMAIRPERIVLREPGEGLVRGTVGEVIYAGSSLIYFIQIGDAGSLTVRVPVQSLGPRPSRGDTVFLSWDAVNALAY